MSRFITVATLLGLVLSQGEIEANNDTQVNSTALQSDFEYRSSKLAMSWDNEALDTIIARCEVYEDLTLFNLHPVRGPYYVELDLVIDSTKVKEKLEVHFCNPVLQNESDQK